MASPGVWVILERVVTAVRDDRRARSGALLRLQALQAAKYLGPHLDPLLGRHCGENIDVEHVLPFEEHHHDAGEVLRREYGDHRHDR